MEAVDLPSGAVTFLLTDVEASTRKWQDDPEAALQAQVRHDALVTDVVSEHGGKVIRTHGEGDSAFAAFSSPSDAVACAVALQIAFAEEPWPGGLEFKVRIGVHTGEAETERANYFGNEVNRCARIRSLAWGGQVLVSEVTARLVERGVRGNISLVPLGRFTLKDFDEPEELYQVCHPDLDPQFPPLRSSWRPHNLPVQLSTFVGREEEIQQIRALLQRIRLLTLVGPGGCGKTRLALEVAATQVAVHSDGVWLVELAALVENQLLPQAVADAVGIREVSGEPVMTSVRRFFQSRRALLILDNCEHLLPSCAALVRDLLASCPDLQILTTSRSPLGLTGEMTWTVPSLGLPEGGHGTPGDLARCDAIRLFVERARLSDPKFELDENNAEAVVQTCTRLDGIPLAIELAAARMRVFNAGQIAERLDDRFKLLSAADSSVLPRQQTLRAAVDWSYDLLGDEEKTVFSRLSVFAGSFSLEAAETVCGFDDVDVVSALVQLAEKSLVVRDPTAGETRYSLLETTRAYAREKLEIRQETERLRDHHLSWSAELVRDDSMPDAARLDLIESEHDNVRAALGWGIEGDRREIALRMTGPLWRFWYMRGHLSEGRAWIVGLLSGADEADPAARADALHTAGILAYRQGDHASAEAFHKESLGLRRELGASGPVAASLNNLGLLALERQELNEAEALFSECLALRKELDDEVGIASPLNNLGLVAHARGDFEKALEAYEASLDIRRRYAQSWGMGIVLDNMGRLELTRGNHAAATRLHSEALELWSQIGDEVSVADCLEHLARVALSSQALERAAVLFGAGASIRNRIGSPLGRGEREQHARDASHLSDLLGKESYERAWATGTAMSVEAAIEYASELGARSS